MTSINKLTQTTSLADNDLSVIWQNSSGRTRAITIANLRKFIQSTDPNADAFVKAELVGDKLILTSHDETETKIDINILPQHSVTELKDMPDTLEAESYLKVNDAGTEFILTPESEISASVVVQEDGEEKGAANVLNFDGLSVEILNRIAKISSAPLNANDGEIMKVEGGKFVPSGVVSKKYGSLSLSPGSVDIGPHTISSCGEGIEATNDSSGESYNFVFAGQGDDNGPVDRTLGDEFLMKTTEDLSLQLTNHSSKLTATGDVRLIKKPVVIKPVSPQTNVTMQVTDLLGVDIWTYGPFDMTIDISGNFEFTESTVLDFKVGEYLVTFLSPDGDVTLYGGVSPISGEDIVYSELPFRPFYDETLHNIKTDGYIVREIEADPDSSITIKANEQGLLVIGDDTSDFITLEEAKLLIELNNDEIITPKQGDQFQFIDSDKSSGYGDSGYITYYGPSYSSGQAINLVKNLDNSKSYFVHRETGSTHGFAMLHESYVSQIYKRDLTDISELTMLFGPKARGRYAKSNQTAPSGTVLNWNGDYIPDTEDPNDLNPSSWIDLSGNVTQDWSSTGIKTPCYSSGFLVNDGSALLQRGDVFCHNNAGVKTSTFTADKDSEFFVMPIKAGGGTLSDLKLLPLFMSRLYETQNEWDSYTFDNSADCVGAILKIAYDSAIESEGDSEALVAAIAKNNLVQADLQTRFGTGTVEINNLEFTVDSITANDINGEA